jgi:hypothetical protein
VALGLFLQERLDVGKARFDLVVCACHYLLL